MIYLYIFLTLVAFFGVVGFIKYHTPKHRKP